MERRLNPAPSQPRTDITKKPFVRAKQEYKGRKMIKLKDVLTTGQVAQICNVAPRTVTKWFDAGRLKGYRIPGSRDRRIPANELVRFMQAHDIPIDGIELGKMRVLIIDSDWETSEALAKALKSKKDYDVQTAQNSFDAGLIAYKLVPHAVLVSLMSKDIDASQICKYIRSNEELSSTKVIAIAGKVDDAQTQALIAKGFDSVLSSSADYDQAVKVIEQVTAIIY
jgi:excisionase family DNA binding protein